MRPRLRRLLNLVTLATPVGLLVARLGGARVVRRTHDGLILAASYRLPVPPAAAFTVGDVVVVRRAELLDRPRLMAHEARHAEQYARTGGLLMIPLYLLAAAWSWLRTGDWASRNVFEVRAGLADGGYRDRELRGWRARRTGSPQPSPVRSGPEGGSGNELPGSS